MRVSTLKRVRIGLAKMLRVKNTHSDGTVSPKLTGSGKSRRHLKHGVFPFMSEETEDIFKHCSNLKGEKL